MRSDFLDACLEIKSDGNLNAGESLQNVQERKVSQSRLTSIISGGAKSTASARKRGRPDSHTAAGSDRNTHLDPAAA